MNYAAYDLKSADYLYLVCRQYPLLVISTECGVGKYHFNCIGYKKSEMMLEFKLVKDSEYEASKDIAEKIGEKYYLTVIQFLKAYKNFALA